MSGEGLEWHHYAADAFVAGLVLIVAVVGIGAAVLLEGSKQGRSDYLDLDQMIATQNQEAENRARKAEEAQKGAERALEQIRIETAKAEKRGDTVYAAVLAAQAKERMEAASIAAEQAKAARAKAAAAAKSAARVAAQQVANIEAATQAEDLAQQAEELAKLQAIKDKALQQTRWQAARRIQNLRTKEREAEKRRQEERGYVEHGEPLWTRVLKRVTPHLPHHHAAVLMIALLVCSIYTPSLCHPLRFTMCTAPIKLATPQFELGLNSPRPTLNAPGYVVVDSGLASNPGAALYRDLVNRTRLFGGGVALRLMDGLERLTPRSMRKGSPGGSSPSGGAEVAPSDAPQGPSNLYMTSSMFRSKYPVPGSPDEVAQDKAKKLAVSPSKSKAGSRPTSPLALMPPPPTSGTPANDSSGQAKVQKAVTTEAETSLAARKQQEAEDRVRAKMKENAKRLERLSSNDAINEFEAALAARADAKRHAERKAKKGPVPPPPITSEGVADHGEPSGHGEPSPKVLKEKLLAEGWKQDPHFPDQWIPPGASTTS